jgi:hypothetical protein
MKNAICTTALSLSAAISLVGCAMTSQKNSAQNYDLVREMYAARQRESAQRSEGKRSAAERIAAENQTSQEAVYITPLSDYKDDWIQKRAEGSDFSDAYTRLLILSRVNGHDDENGIAGSGASKPLSYDGRLWISRVLVERNYSINLTAKVSAGSFEATVPLATISHQSGSQGEKWSRTVHHTRQNFPLFLVPASGSASTPTLRIMVNGDRSYSSSAAATAVQVTYNTAQLTGWSSGVITALSADGARDQARAMDQAISKLFGAGLSEEHWSDRDLRYWSTDDTHRPRGARVTFKIPSEVKNWNSTPLTVGEWTITFDYPRPSVFADWRICPKAKELPRCAPSRMVAQDNVLREVNAGEVLNYPVAPGTQGLGTIRAYLAQKDWFTSSQSALADSTRRTTAASSMCRMIINEMTGIGLNGFDANIVVWAVVTGMPIENVQILQTASDCKRSIEMVDRGRSARSVPK